MTDFLPQLFLHMSPALVIGAVIYANHVSNRRRHSVRAAEEGARLAAALVAELKGLRETYSENLDMIARDAGPLLSTRAATPVFRGSIGRLPQLMDGRTLTPVVAAYAQNERIEAALAGIGRRPAANEPGVQEMKPRYVRGNRHIAAALIALSPDGTPAPEQRARQKAPVPLIAAEPSSG